MHARCLLPLAGSAQQFVAVGSVVAWVSSLRIRPRLALRSHLADIVILTILLTLASRIELLAGTYTTSFPLTENPISESGMWVNGQADGLLWANCITTNHFVWGNDNRGVVYADPTALLKG